MRPMAPSNSEFRQLPNRREPTDMEKTMRIGRRKRAMARSRLANKQPVPTFVPDSSERINKMQIANLQGLGNTYPAASTIDSNPGNDPAFRNVNGELVETWARPEPSPQYQANYFALMTEIDNKASEAALVEQNLLQVNQDIIALETKGQAVPNALKAEAEQLYYKLSKLRKDLDSSARELDSKGYTIRRRNTWGGRLGYSGGGFLLGAAAFYGLYQFYNRRLSGGRRSPSRASGNVDPLAAFGRING
ncbi:hypothetical protein N9N26_01085 [Candidatus Poseidoniales archaeon]|jgi:hypothetical protein|nr:hypothetical protein [Candidatus Poseidoniales archaeon]